MLMAGMELGMIGIFMRPTVLVVSVSIDKSEANVSFRNLQDLASVVINPESH